MRIEVYAICYNEEVRMPYFLRHYSGFADKIIIYDNNSTDKSREICRGKAEVLNFDTEDKLRDDVFLNIKEHCWKKSKADWVIVCDIDEFVYHKDIRGVLKNSNATIFMPRLFNMISDKLPTTEGQIYDEIKYGVEDERRKSLIFRPDKINEINYEPGCHKAFPRGEVIYGAESILTLHFQYLSLDYTIQRYAEFSKRLSMINKINGWSFHYSKSEKQIKKMFKKMQKNAIKVI